MVVWCLFLFPAPIHTFTPGGACHSVIPSMLTTEYRFHWSFISPPLLLLTGTDSSSWGIHAFA